MEFQAAVGDLDQRIFVDCRHVNIGNRGDAAGQPGRVAHAGGIDIAGA